MRLPCRRRGYLWLPAILAAPSGRRGYVRLPALFAAPSGRRGYRRLTVILLFAEACATALSAQGRASAPRPLEIEVADLGRNRILCMHHEGPPLAAGAAVWLVQPDTPQSVARAVPGAGPCTPRADLAEKALVPLKVVGGVLDSMRLSIAIVGAPRAPVARGGRVAADLDGDGVPERFRACASSEGVHLTIWSGARLRWHRYFYLGYDVEPDCPESDIHNPAPGAALGRREAAR